VKIVVQYSGKALDFEARSYTPVNIYHVVIECMKIKIISSCLV